MHPMDDRTMKHAQNVCENNQAAEEAIDDEFQALATIWKSQTRLFSNVNKRAMHPAYQQIIGMGPAVVPSILRDLATNGPNDWFWALTAITRENPITKEIAGNMEALTEAWLRWGQTAGYLTDSTPKTKQSFPSSQKPGIG